MWTGLSSGYLDTIMCLFQAHCLTSSSGVQDSCIFRSPKEILNTPMKRLTPEILFSLVWRRTWVSTSLKFYPAKVKSAKITTSWLKICLSAFKVIFMFDSTRITCCLTMIWGEGLEKAWRCYPYVTFLQHFLGYA